MQIRDFWPLLKATFSEWSEDKASRLAAALAYYTVFSIAPLLIIVIAIASVAFANAEEQLMAQVRGLVGAQGEEQIRMMIEQTSRPSASIPAMILGIATLLLGASGVFGQLHESLNTIWEVQPKPGRGILAVVKDRFVSFTMVLGIGFLLLVSLVLSAVLTAMSDALGVGGTLGQFINFVVGFGVITLLFAMIYRILPDVEIEWSDVWVGAAVTALLFSIGRTLIGLYLGRSTAASAYGAAGSLVVILLWIYYSAQILFLGAEFTQVYARRYGSRIQPDEDAVESSVVLSEAA